jgi:sec-independent protein translocase protein TatA
VFGNIGAPELIIILVIALIVLGPGKLPDVAASLGKGVREFRRAATDLSDAAKVEPEVAPPAASVATAPAPAQMPVAAPQTTAPDPGVAAAPAPPPANTPADAVPPNSLGEGSAPKPAGTDDG